MLKKSELTKIVNSLSVYNVFDIAWQARIPGICDGIAELNLNTGKVEGASLEPNFQDRGNYMVLYGIDKDIEFPDDLDLLDDIDRENYEENHIDFEDFLEDEGIDADELREKYWKTGLESGWKNKLTPDQFYKQEGIDMDKLIEKYKKKSISFEQFCEQEGIDIDELQEQYLYEENSDNLENIEQEWLNDLDDAFGYRREDDDEEEEQN